MSFRARLALVAAAAVALAVVAASGVVYLVVRDQLYSSIDNSLRTSMDRIVTTEFSIGEGPPQPGVFGGYPQVVRADGVVFRRRGQSLELPVDEETIAVARGERPPSSRTGRPGERTSASSPSLTAPGSRSRSLARSRRRTAPSTGSNGS